MKKLPNTIRELNRRLQASQAAVRCLTPLFLVRLTMCQARLIAFLMRLASAAGARGTCLRCGKFALRGSTSITLASVCILPDRASRQASRCGSDRAMDFDSASTQGSPRASQSVVDPHQIEPARRGDGAAAAAVNGSERSGQIPGLSICPRPPVSASRPWSAPDCAGTSAPGLRSRSHRRPP